ncbi:MAG: hypothetical protein SF051_16930 [Elusimicrobiota bacterium]|nr:hypothetical protein [Elusimicrobiota bacterium]
MRVALALIALLAAPASALEEEFRRGESAAARACWPVYNDPPVSAPVVKTPKGAVDERLTRRLRAGTLRAARALRRLESDAARAACPPYGADDAIRKRWLEFAAAAGAASQEAAREWDAVNLSWTVEWEEVPLSRLEETQKGEEEAPGPFAGVCRPPAVSTEVFVPSAGQAASREEREAFERLAADARALSRSLAEMTAGAAALFEALEGRGCSELARRFHAMASTQRREYFEHRDRVLGRLLRGRLKWEPLPPAP